MTYRQVEIPDTVIVSNSPKELHDLLMDECAKPWIVEFVGYQMLAFGPWKVVEVQRHTLQGAMIFTVMRDRLRRSKIVKNKHHLPHGRVWRKPTPMEFGLTPEGVINLP